MPGHPPATSPAGSADSGSSASAEELQWYIGRDGQQRGPIGDAEFRNLIARRQLHPADLVWREGFPDWRPVASLQLPPLAPQPSQSTAPASPASKQHTAAKPTASAAPERKRKPAGRTRKFGRGLAWSAFVLFFAVTLGAAYLHWTGNKDLMRIASAIIQKFPERAVSTAPITGFAATAEASDQAMQKSLLWQVLKKYHPDWYSERVKEATEAARAQKPDAEIAAGMMQAIVKLRRENAGNAYSAPAARLKSIAVLFAANLTRLRASSTDACFQFISTGESGPSVVSLLQSSEYTSGLQAQLAATFEAINEGRRTPRIYPQPQPSDYDALVKILEARGWKRPDMQLFSDSQALAKAPPETVCRLVTEWFESQLAIDDPDIQLRLIVDSLRPVVAG